MADIAFLITGSKLPPDPSRIVENARALSLSLATTADALQSGAETQSFSFDNERPGILMSTFIPVQHPDVANLSSGPHPPNDADVQAASSHMILIGFGIEGSENERDALMSVFTAAVCRSTDSVAAMVGQDANFQRADRFTELVGLIPDEGSAFDDTLEL